MLVHPYAVALDQIPQLTFVPAPALSAMQSELLERTRADLPAGSFDGPVLMISGCEAQEIQVFEATYSWAIAHLRHPEFAEASLGQLGVGLILSDGEGRVLWQRAANTQNAGSWSHSVQGGVDPGEGLRAALLRETREEIGLGEDDIEHLRPAFLFVEAVSMTAVFTATLRHPVALTAPEDEVAELLWTDDPASLEPTCDRWRALRAEASALGLLPVPLLDLP